MVCTVREHTPFCSRVKTKTQNAVPTCEQTTSQPSKKQLPMEYDDAVLITGLITKKELNNRIGRICASRTRVSTKTGLTLRPVQLLVGANNYWVPEANLTRIDPDVDVSAHEFKEVPNADRMDLFLYLKANEGTEVIPDVGRICNLNVKK